MFIYIFIFIRANIERMKKENALFKEELVSLKLLFYTNIYHIFTTKIYKIYHCLNAYLYSSFI